MSNGLAIDFLGDTLKRAGAYRTAAFPGKYAALAMTPQTGLVSLNVGSDGVPTGNVAINIDPFYKKQLEQHRSDIAKRLSNTGPKPQSPKPAQGQALKSASIVPFMHHTRRSHQKINVAAPSLARPRINAVAPKNSTMASLPRRLGPENRASLRLATAQPSKTYEAAKLRELDSLPAQGLQIPARDLRLNPQFMLGMRRQKLLAMGCG